VIWTGASELTNVKTRLATVEAQTEKMTSAVNTLRENLQYIRGELAGVRRTLQEER
jgi:capsule polysaccharide export protein KpsE/RkpR